MIASNYARKRLLLNFFSLATHSSNPPTQPNAVPSRLLQRKSPFSCAISSKLTEDSSGPSNPSQLQPQVREEIQGALFRQSSSRVRLRVCAPFSTSRRGGGFHAQFLGGASHGKANPGAIPAPLPPRRPAASRLEGDQPSTGVCCRARSRRHLPTGSRGVECRGPV